MMIIYTCLKDCPGLKDDYLPLFEGCPGLKNDYLPLFEELSWVKG